MLSPVRLLIDETFATATYTVPITSGWVSLPDGITVEIANRLTTDSASEERIVLAPASEILHLQQTHQVAGDVAVIADGNGAIAMRTPVRPDEVEATPVRLLATSGVAELLARATLRPFYGIEPTSWVRASDSPEAARAEAVIVEGAEALREPEAGFSEDLSRAWFILTAQPVVSHVLLVPRTLPLNLLREALTFLGAASTEALARRREWRPDIADREGVGRDRASAFWAAQRLKLEPADRRALLDLLGQGSRGTSNPSPANVTFIDGTGSQ
jgi:predicted solute-binding protein